MVRFLFVLLLLFPWQSVAAERQFSVAGRTVTEWKPSTQSYGKAPVVLFSHAYHGCATDSRYILQALSAKGFWVFAPNHRDAVCKGRNAELANVPQKEGDFKKPKNWDADTYSSRMDDLNTLLESLRNDDSRRDDLDFSRIALAGYELGGYTVLGMAGGWPDWKGKWDNYGVKAILALSPYTQPYNIAKTWGEVTLPVMIQGGTKDHRTQFLTMPKSGTYFQLTSPKYLAIVKDAQATAWTVDKEETRDPIIRYATAFLQYYLLGEESPILSQGSDRLTTYAYTSELGEREIAGKKGVAGLSSTTRGGNSPSTTIKGGNSGGAPTIRGGNSGGEPTTRAGSWRDRNGRLSTFGTEKPKAEDE